MYISFESIFIWPKEFEEIHLWCYVEWNITENSIKSHLTPVIKFYSEWTSKGTFTSLISWFRWTCDWLVINQLWMLRDMSWGYGSIRKAGPHFHTADSQQVHLTQVQSKHFSLPNTHTRQSPANIYLSAQTWHEEARINHCSKAYSLLHTIHAV